MPVSAKLIKELDKLQPDLKAVLLELLAEIERNREESIPRKEFWEFASKTEEHFHKVWKALGELAEAEKRTDKRIEELAEAQKRTEQRVQELAEAQERTEKRVEELAEAQKRTDKRIEELAEAQKRTEQRVQELAEAQERTEKRVEELAEAQKRTEVSIQKLTRRMDKFTVELGGLSHTVGYGLEDKAYPVLRKLLKQEFDLEIDRLYRKNLVYSPSKFDEINIYGEARQNGKKVYVIGESKAQFGVRDVDRFTRLLERVKAHLGAQVFPVALAYHYHPHAEEKLKEKGIRFFWSYELSEP